MYLDGRLATRRELLSRFPADRIATDPELAALAAGDRRMAGSLSEAERYLALAERKSGSVPEDRRERFQVSLVIVRLTLARARNDLDAVAEQAQRLLELADSPHAIEAGVGDEGLRATALIDLGAAEMWAGPARGGRAPPRAGARGGPADRPADARATSARRTWRSWASFALRRSGRSAPGRRSSWRERTGGRRPRRPPRARTSRSAPWPCGAGGSPRRRRWLDHAELVLQRFAEPTTAMMIYTATRLAGVRARPARGRDDRPARR